MLDRTELPNKGSPCPACGTVLEVSQHIHGHNVEPEKDDISVCFTCGAVSLYNADLTFRLCDIEKLDAGPLQKAEIRRASEYAKARRKN